MLESLIKSYLYQKATFLLLFEQSDGLELLDDVGEGVGDDGDHDEEREDEDEHGGHDGLYILTIQVVLLPGSSAADCCHKTPSECGVWTHDPVQ